MITIYTSESGTRSKNVYPCEAESHRLAGGCYSTESEILLAFMACDEIPSSLFDCDGDKWTLVNQGAKRSEDFFVYDLAR